MKKKRLLSLVMALAMICGFAAWVPGFDINANAGATLVWPVPGTMSYKKVNNYHNGNAIDISGSDIAGYNVVAAMGGTVIAKFLCGSNHWDSPTGDGLHDTHTCHGFGNGIVIQGDDGRIYQYAHMQAGSIPSGVYNGAYVSAGQNIGKVGMTGYASGYHLHFGISKGEYWYASGINPYEETYVDGTKPAWAYISLPKYQFHVGEDIPFYFTSDITTDFTLGVFDSNGVEVYGKNIHGNSANVIINKPGHYHAFVNAYGTGGVTDSGTIYFNVRDPADLGDCFYANIINSAIAKYVTNVNSNAALYSANGENNQIWLFRKQANGSYTIESYGTGKFLDDANYGNTNGANVGIAAKSGEDNVAQQWNIYSDTTTYDTVTYRIATLCGDLMLNVDGGLSDDGTNINLYSDLNNYPQNFTIRKLCDANEDLHKYSDWSKTSEPDCTKDGIESRSCQFCGKTETRTIDKTGHSWGEPTYTWSTDNKTCTATRSCAYDISHKETETVNTSYAVTNEATETSEGTGKYTAKFTNTAFATKTKTVTIPALSHTHEWGNPTYSWSSDYKTCTATRVCTKDSSHKETETVYSTSVIKTAATCTAKGTKTYSATFENPAFAKQTKNVTNIPAIGHDWNQPIYEWSADKKTCTAIRTCANDNSHKETETVNSTYVVTKEPTENSDGIGTYTAKFTNTAFETKTKTVTIPTFSHTHEWGDPTYSWSSDYKTCTATRVCTKDSSHKEIETVNTSYAVTTEPTETTDGIGKYTARFTSNAFSTQTKTVSIPALSHTHSWGEPTYTWSSDYKTCTATRVCTLNSSHTETETVNSSSTVKKPATCSVKGTTTYTAIFTNKAFANQTKDVQDIEVKEHTWSEWKTTAFDVAKGTSTQTRTCSTCNKTESKTTEKAIQRLAGAGRYETAAKISQAAFDQADTVVLANGLNYADALAGVSLATKMNAPILLTNTKTLDATTLAEIKRLKAKNVIILGGTGAISDQVKEELENNGLTTERIAGASRFGTATAIAEKQNENPTDIFFVYAFNSADALSVSPIAASKNAPIIYLSTKGDLNADTATYLAKLKMAGCVKNAYVIGGEGVISNDMATKAAKALGLSKATRIAGKDRFATCVAVNEQFKDTLNGDMLCVATGMDFPDALAGGVYAAINKAPLFLINGKLKTPKLTDEQKAYLKAKATAKITAFGGVGVVPDNHIADIAKNSI